MNNTKPSPQKKWIWIPHPTKTFTSAYIISEDTTTVTVETQDNKILTIDKESTYKMNPPKFDNIDDLASLSYLNEPSVLHNLASRYYNDIIYTYSGLFLVAINPYKKLKIYSSSTVSDYHIGKPQDLPPHIYATASLALRNMLYNRENQSILITGESGAGKTENTKKVIQFLTTIAPVIDRKHLSSISTHEINNLTDTDVHSQVPVIDRKHSSSLSTHEINNSTDTNVHNQVHTIEHQIFMAHPILESFGNAQTIKNNNSSRFGKFIKILFNNSTITGAYIEKYLLEKSRVTHQNSNERNYHIFYQLLSGADQPLKEKLLLDGNINDYTYISTYKADRDSKSDRHTRSERGSTSYHQPIKDTVLNTDTQDFITLNNCFDVLKITEEERLNYFTVISAILHLGNIEVLQQNDQAYVNNTDTVEKVCTLLKIDTKKFLSTLLHPISMAGTEKVMNMRNRHQVINIIEALSRTLYERLFDTVIERLNCTLNSKIDTTKFIGVLDIAGFEIFKNNSFEQLCINYTNEKLQQFFNHHMFVLEQELYRQENIQWDYIDFGLDLQPTIDVIDKSSPIGVMSYLDEECVIPKGSDKTFLEKVICSIKGKGYGIEGVSDRGSKQQGVSYSTGNNTPSDIFGPLRLKNGFFIKHYAGKVEYLVDGWIEKNKDTYFDSFSTLLLTSTNTFIKDLFDCYISTTKKGFFRTVSQRHKEEITSLMTQLTNTSPHFVRCILPNTLKKNNLFDCNIVLQQLRCNGVLEGIRISRLGYPGRMTFREFKKRYNVLISKRVICSGVGGVNNKDPNYHPVSYKGCKQHPVIHTTNQQQGDSHTTTTLRDSATLILTTLDIPTDSYRIGITKVFFKQGVLGDLEDIRDSIINILSKEVVSLYLKVLVIRKYTLNKRHSKNIKILQKNLKILLNIKRWKWFRLYLKIKPLFVVTHYEVESKKLKECISTLTTDNAQYKASLDKLQTSYTRIEKELSVSNNLLVDYEERIREYVGRVSDLEERFSKYEEKCSKYEERCCKYEETINNLEDRIEDKDKTITELEDVIQEKDKTISNYKDRIEDKDKTISNYENKIKNLEDVIEGKHKTITEYENKLRDALIKFNDSNNKLQQLQTLYNNKIKDLQIIKEQHTLTLKELKDKYEENKNKEIMEDKNKGLEDKNRELKDKNKGLEAKNRELEDKNKGLEDRNKELEDKNRKLEDKNRELEDKNKGLDHKVSELTTSNNNLTYKVSDLTMQVSTLTTNYKELENNYKFIGNLKGEEVEELREECNVLNKRCNDMKNRVSELEEENKRYKDIECSNRGVISVLECKVECLERRCLVLGSRGVRLEGCHKDDEGVSDVISKASISNPYTNTILTNTLVSVKGVLVRVERWVGRCVRGYEEVYRRVLSEYRERVGVLEREVCDMKINLEGVNEDNKRLRLLISSMELKGVVKGVSDVYKCYRELEMLVGRFIKGCLCIEEEVRVLRKEVCDKRGVIKELEGVIDKDVSNEDSILEGVIKELEGVSNEGIMLKDVSYKDDGLRLVNSLSNSYSPVNTSPLTQHLLTSNTDPNNFYDLLLIEKENTNMLELKNKKLSEYCMRVMRENEKLKNININMLVREILVSRSIIKGKIIVNESMKKDIEVLRRENMRSRDIIREMERDVYMKDVKSEEDFKMLYNKLCGDVRGLREEREYMKDKVRSMESDIYRLKRGLSLYEGRERVFMREISEEKEYNEFLRKIAISE